MDELDEFTSAYVETALWSSTDDNDQPLDANYSPEDIYPDTLQRMIADCEQFQRENAIDIETAIESGEVVCGPDFGEMGRAGHDFWLTRNRHGAGFWDGDWPDKQAERLTEASHTYGEFNLYVDDDGKIHGA